jgi:prepilin-type N-terminal cleavage/methylation domain-containing protein
MTLGNAKTEERPMAKSQRGFTLVELLVVIAIIGILAALLTPVVTRARQEGFKTTCKSNLGQIAKACTMYADNPPGTGKKGLLPWSKPLQSGGSGQLTDDGDARACLELLYKHDFIDDPKIFVCPAASTDDPAEHIDDLADRKASFNLDDFTCSYTYRNKLTDTNANSKTPITGDKRGGEQTPTNHKDGRHVAFLNGNVEFYTSEVLDDASNKDAKKFRDDLLGFGSSR